MRKPVMFECPRCAEFHPTDVMLSCGEAATSFTKAELDRWFGPDRWIAVASRLQERRTTIRGAQMARNAT